MPTKQLSFKHLPKVASLPPPAPELEGVLVELLSDKLPYYCDGSVWSLLAGGGGTQQVFVQSIAPTVPAGTQFLWVQTGLGDDGEDFTMWAEDGL